MRTVTADFGAYATTFLITADSLDLLDETITDGLKEAFAHIVENASTPTPLPMSVVEHLHGDRLHAEVRDDGHTYIGEERID
jgi:hypothetical protein